VSRAQHGELIDRLAEPSCAVFGPRAQALIISLRSGIVMRFDLSLLR
jgi:hypothetical protein